VSARARLLAPVALAAALGGCAGLRGAPAGRAGWVSWRVGDLTVELPGDWTARGDERTLSVESPDGRAVARVERVARPFGSEAECLGKAEGALGRGVEGIERGRRHPTRIGGRPALLLEGDVGAWHAWAWGACDGGSQYRLSFVGVTPIGAEIVEVRRAFEGSARFGVAPGAIVGPRRVP
jgi:hypothetical protein